MDRDENLRKWRVSRRRFLQLAGLGGAGAVVAAAVPAVVRAAGAQSPAASHPPGIENGRLRRWMMIIDQRRCDGCQSQHTPPQCTEACIEGHFVPEPMQWIEVYEHELSGEGALQVRDRHNDGVSPSLPIEGTTFLPTPCMQCQNPPCVNVCPVGATWSTPEGVVLIDQNRCIGCRLCMSACPYERRFYTWGKPPVPVESHFVTYSPEHQAPMQKGVVYKCDFCPDMARAGRLPYCAQACPQNAIYYGDLEEDVATNGEEVVKISRFLGENSGYRYKEDLGTRPRVYYIPGHGELAGRKPADRGRMPVRWQWEAKAGSKKWKRSRR